MEYNKLLCRAMPLMQQAAVPRNAIAAARGTDRGMSNVAQQPCDSTDVLILLSVA